MPKRLSVLAANRKVGRGVAQCAASEYDRTLRGCPSGSTSGTGPTTAEARALVQTRVRWLRCEAVAEPRNHPGLAP